MESKRAKNNVVHIQMNDLTFPSLFETALPNFLTVKPFAPGKFKEADILAALIAEHKYSPRLAELTYVQNEPCSYKECQCGVKFWSQNDYKQHLQPTTEQYELLIAYRDDQHQIRMKNLPKKHAGHELGAREFTFTYSPKWFTDTDARIEMTKSMGKLIKYYEDDITHLRAVGEVGTNGLSHIHCFYKLRGGVKITDKNFKRAWKYWNPKKQLGWGFEGGHHATVKSESDFLGYIDKDIDSAWYEKLVKPLTD